MQADELKWERNTALKHMADRYNDLVDAVSTLAREVADLNNLLAQHRGECGEQFHDLNDKYLTVNYKYDELQRDINQQLADIQREISRKTLTI